MRLLIQRVTEATLRIDNQVRSAIGKGMLVLVGIEHEDSVQDMDWLAGKLSRLRIFDDEAGVMNLDINQIGGEVMVVSQFTLHASTKKGNRPSYIRSAPESISRPLYEEFVAKVEQVLGKSVATGLFGADMQISLVNDGPVTIWIDSKHRE